MPVSLIHEKIKSTHLKLISIALYTLFWTVSLKTVLDDFYKTYVL